MRLLSSSLVKVLDGEVEIKISGNPFHLKQGEMIMMPTNNLHSLKVVRQFKMLLLVSIVSYGSFIMRSLDPLNSASMVSSLVLKTRMKGDVSAESA